MGSSPPPQFAHYASAQSTFSPPLIANGNAFLGDVFSSDSTSPNTPISAGFYRLDPGPELVYEYTYDEMKIVLEGDFEIEQVVSEGKGVGEGIGEGELNGNGNWNGEVKEDEEKGKNKAVKAGKGDVFFFPKGVTIRFRTRGGGLAWYCGQRGKDTA